MNLTFFKTTLNDLIKVIPLESRGLMMYKGLIYVMISPDSSIILYSEINDLEAKYIRHDVLTNNYTFAKVKGEETGSVRYIPIIKVSDIKGNLESEFKSIAEFNK